MSIGFSAMDGTPTRRREMNRPPRVEPVAIVGIGCRFPGAANDAESFWKLLAEGRSGIREVPPDRWNLDRYYHPDPATSGAMTTRWGGFVDNLDTFDAGFWGVSPREAIRMDPQQRWLLEVAWESIEDSGTAPRELRGRDIGVFLGISGNDYGGLQLRDAVDVDAYTNSGSTASIAPNRVSYMLDLRGPSVSVDTACSSSLVAVWMACENIWSGHCDAALAGGVNALIAPQTSVGFSKAAMTSRTGQCFAFDARANGYVRAEGAGVVYLKPLALALANRDRVYAVIRAAAVNQDGHTSSMTVPSVDGQAAMLREVYRQAGIAAARVVYVEAHGTGTPVGDPIEATALGRVVGEGRSAGSKCLIGSVKTNIGHLEAASGIAGLIKAALVVHRRMIPASLNYEHPNPHIPFEELRLDVASQLQPLPATDGQPPLVAVNSFGFGGTNAHVVLETAPALALEAPPATQPCDRPCVLPISARDETALRSYVQAYRAVLADRSQRLSDVCAFAGERKEHHNHRLVVIGHSPEDMRNRAATWLRDGSAAGVVVGRTMPHSPPVFVFTGQGAQWWAMGRQLLQREPIVRRAIAEIDAWLEPLAGWSLIAEMMRAEADSNIDRTDIAQPALFALQVALAELWKSWGVVGAKAIGHSVGEVAAAYYAGVYSLEDAVKVIFHRSRLQHRTSGKGRMLAVALSPDEAREAIGADADRVELGGINGPRLVTLTGDAEPLEHIASRLQTSGVFTRWLRIQYAFHSRHMNPIQDELVHVLAKIQPRPSRIPFISTATGEPIPGELLDAGYWWKNVRRPVLFGPAISSLIDAGHEIFMELGPHPALESSLKECIAERGRNGAVFHSLRRETDESREMLTNLAGLHAVGVPIDWRAVNQGSGGFVRLPHYPWNRSSFWLESRDSAQSRLAPPVHPLLGLRVAAALPTWQFTLDLHRLAYLNDHRLWDSVVFPAAGYAEMGLALARLLFPDEPHAVEDLQIKTALFVGDDESPAIQIVFNPDDKSFAVYSSTRKKDGWDLHAHATLTRMTPGDPPALNLEQVRAPLVDHFNHEQYCQEFSARGYQFGPSFQQVQHVWRVPGEALVEIEAPRPVAEAVGGYRFHPAVLDACFHAFMGLPAAAPGAPRQDELFLPQSFRRIHLYREQAPARLWAHARLGAYDGAFLLADILVYDDHGRRVADILGFRLDRMHPKRPADDLDDCYYRFEWQPRWLRGSGVQGTCSFPSAAEIVAGARTAVPELRERHRLDDYHRAFVPQAEAALFQLVQRAFTELGWQPRLAERFDLQGFVDALGIAGEYRRLTRNLLRDLETHGCLRSSEESVWEVLRLPDTADGSLALDALAEKYPTSAAEIALLRRAGLNLAKVLRGETDALELLFPGGSQEYLESYYSEGAAFPAHLELMRRGVANAVASLPPRRALRVLEVGAGTGVLTRAVLPVLPSDRTEYVFTDVGPGFLTAARNRLAEFPFIDYQVFDLEEDAGAQGIPAGRFDLVLASQVLHATANLRQTLTRLRTCLAPGGLLMFLELVKRDLLRYEVVFGLLKGFWRFSDIDLRPRSALLGRAQWETLLTECGFRDVTSMSCTEDEQQAEHAAFIGFAPSAEPDSTCQPVPTSGARRYLLFADEQGVAESFRDRLQQLGHRSILVRRGDAFEQDSAGSFRVSAESNDDIRRVLATDAVASGELAGVIHCWSLDHPRARGMDIEELRAAQQSGVMSGFRLIRALADARAPVWFVTRNVHRVTNADRGDGLASAPLVGLTRVANNEHQCRFSLVDLDDCSCIEASEHLLAEVTLPRDGEFETAYRSGVRHVLRLHRVRPDQLPKRLFNAVLPDGSVAPYRLQTDKPGILANLALHETERRAPGPNEIEVRVQAGGINFRDVMKALGTHPGNPIDLLWFGDDFSGVVERVGKNVDAFQRGDEVAGMAAYSFQSYATTDARMVFRKPAHMSFAQAATLPTAFLTAHYALNHLGRMQPGERILIHAGAGGVGQAAIQIAKHLSLEIFATAGTAQKRQVLTDMGVHHVMNSRTLAFADEVMAITDGRGVDAALNCLAGDFIPKSLSVLAPFGRFLEIGKVDVYRNSKIGLELLRNNISYFVIDLTQHLREKPAFIVQMLAELGERFAARDYRPLPYTSFPITQAGEAFRFMAHAKHVGKNVLTFDLDAIPIAFCTNDDRRFRPQATYLITGGAGGFGLEVAKWIARHGGRHVVLLSRSGPRGRAARRDIDELRAAGVVVVDARGDVTRPEDVDRVVRQICAELPPLKGVFHAAMVLDDEFLTALDESRFRQVLEPKMAGAWNLHVATQDLSLEHFVGFSSFSAVIAEPKQSSYNAGNVFLDALTHYRHAQGLPALTVDWGALLGAGFVERNQKTAEFLATIGFGAFQIEEALRVLGRMLFLDPVQVVAARANWQAVLKLSQLVASSNTYTAVARESLHAEHGGALAARLRVAGADEQARLMEEFIVAQVAGVFGMVEGKIDRGVALTSLGLDSLMTLELMNRVERELGLRIPMGTLLSGPSITELARTVLRLLAPTLAGSDVQDVTAIPPAAPSAASEPTVTSTAAPPDRYPHRDEHQFDAAPRGKRAGGQDHVVLIRAAGNQPPLFVFHPVGGGVGIYAGLAPYLPEDVPLYGIESRLMRGAETEYADLDEMVNAYVAAIRGVHDGPYRLFGFSLGGYLAARAAEELEQAGEIVQFVGVIDWDARHKVTAEAQRESLIRLSMAAYLFLQEEAGIVRPRPEKQLRGEISQLVDRVSRESEGGGEVFFRWVVANELTASKNLEGVTRQYLSRFEQHCRLLTRELPVPRFRAPLFVWRARDGFGSGLESWEHMGDVSREHVFDGDHNALIRPAALRVVAEQTCEFLRQVCRAEPATYGS
jgi:acyl transferase domain-containing protein/NADPH:quinone reductase-like Zn-dependent oxidoreductase/thioesterase domain-containing protein/acyl carrier protein